MTHEEGWETMTRIELKDTLAYYGIRPGLRSSMQIVELLEKILWEPARSTMLEGYAAVGTRYGVRPVQVERNVHARILYVWRTGDDRLLQSLLPWRTRLDPPGNREFLYALAARIRMEYLRRGRDILAEGMEGAPAEQCI